MFVWNGAGPLQYLEIEEFKDNGVTAIFTSRRGGVSKGSYGTLNLGFHSGDDHQNVVENRKIISSSIKIDYHNFVAGEQVHGNKVYIVAEEDKGKGALDYNTSISGVDALITDRPGLPLISFYADCVPLYFLAPSRRVIALAHAGWKGTLLKIGQKTIEKMNQYFDINIKNCLAAIGPSISPDVYEVDDRVVGRFKEKFTEWRDIVVDKGKGYYLLNLWEANRIVLNKAGIPSKNIITSGYCTYKYDNFFYSYRRDGAKTGRMASIIVI
ncbi:peptidoglycan editing factor PgeF [Halothermothrix orenii]|uniref:Purine nucleoside phosphorylase n=1 Tax=Halothermothrix orenii (strain H 168 / OCM 544 / DSM 9562) TaxID=373903 RepID=B8CWK7_HALOH|nr:peptidoglycan editing factor PgeF [Halothermothrix orenii]ACL69676.1 conserved hypothetical protein TIGR00726 [Halothermothrix orenii H 168]